MQYLKKRRWSFAKLVEKSNIANKSKTCKWCVAVEYYLQILGAKINEEYDDDWQENPVMRHDLTQPTSHSAYSLPAANEHLQDYDSLQHLFQEYNLSGPQVTVLDTWKAQHWDLFTHPGFLTYPHHDGAGNATFTFMRYGCKIWGAIRPRIPSGDTSRRTVFNVLRQILRPTGNPEYMESSDIFNIFLLPGDLLIQPSNQPHMVYTPTYAIASGGHFTCYEGLHMTEIARSFDRAYARHATNAPHPGMYRTLCRMTIALPTICNTRGAFISYSQIPSLTNVSVFYRRPILALLSMILRPNAYQLERMQSDSEPYMSKYDVLRLESEADRVEAQRVASRILAHHGLSVEQLTEELEDVGPDWKDGSAETMDLSFLKGEE